MDVNFSRAANAYQNNLKLGAEGGDDVLGGGDAEKPSFFKDLLSAAEKAIGGLEQSEAVRNDAIAGKADLTNVVTAVANAELTLNTIVAVRDRVISAYQDIIRMPI